MATDAAPGEVFNAAIKWVDANGNPAPVDGPTTWASSDPGTTVVANATDSTQATVTCGTTPMAVRITGSADAKLGTAVNVITCIGDINILAGEAVAGTMTFTPEPAPAP